MNPWPDDIHALLSGMLDGVLSAAEEERLNRLLAEDPELQKELEAITAMRSSLLKGRQHGRLGSQFARRVVQAAAARKSFDDEHFEPGFTSEWIPSSESGTVATTKVDAQLPHNKRIWIPLLSVAAAAAIALFAMQISRLTREYNQQHIANSDSSEQSTISSSTHSDSSDRLGEHKETVAANGAAPSPNSPLDPMASDSASTSESPRLAENATGESKAANEQIEISPSTETSESAFPEPASAVLADAGMKPADELNPDRSNAIAADQTSQKSNMTDGSVAKSASTVNASKVNASKTKEPTAPAVPAYALMAVHITQDAIAIQNRSLSRILDHHNILAIDDLAITDEELSTLMATGAAGKLDEEGANIYFLKGYARNLSGAIEDLCAQYKNFPEFGINITFDDSAIALVAQLQNIDIGAEPAVAAKVGINTPNGFVASFSRGHATPKAMPLQRREAMAPTNMLASIDTNPISYLLLVVRNANEVNDSSEVESSPQDEVAD